MELQKKSGDYISLQLKYTEQSTACSKLSSDLKESINSELQTKVLYNETVIKNEDLNRQNQILIQKLMEADTKIHDITVQYNLISSKCEALELKLRAPLPSPRNTTLDSLPPTAPKAKVMTPRQHIVESHKPEILTIDNKPKEIKPVIEKPIEKLITIHTEKIIAIAEPKEIKPVVEKTYSQRK